MHCSPVRRQTTDAPIRLPNRATGLSAIAMTPLPRACAIKHADQPRCPDFSAMAVAYCTCEDQICDGALSTVNVDLDTSFKFHTGIV